jgi:CBS domain-containing protein
MNNFNSFSNGWQTFTNITLKRLLFTKGLCIFTAKFYHPHTGGNRLNSQTLRSPIETLEPSKPICVEVGTPVNDVIDIMKENRFGGVFVVKNGKLAGVFTERDVLYKIVAGGYDSPDTTIEEVMTHYPEYLFHDDQIAFALNRMHVGGFRHIPLLGMKGMPIGVVSVRDILAFLNDNLFETN